MACELIRSRCSGAPLRNTTMSRLQHLRLCSLPSYNTPPCEAPTDSLALLVILGLTQALTGADRGGCGRGKGREV